MATATSGSNTATQILDVACELVQTRGYNAFSFRDLAAEIGIKSASIHHHFPTKADLCKAMIRRYREDFSAALQLIDESAEHPAERLRAYFDLFSETARSEGGVCLAGMLAADLLTLAPEAQAELRGFFTDSEQWLRSVLAAGAAAGELSVHGSPKDVAVGIVSALEGALMVARAHSDPASFDRTSRWLLASLTES